MSVTTIWRAPMWRHTAQAMRPMGPAPVMSTSSPTTSNDSAQCTALPKGSSIEAMSEEMSSCTGQRFVAGITRYSAQAPTRSNTSLAPTVGTGAWSIQRPGSARRLTRAFIGAAPVCLVLSLAHSRVGAHRPHPAADALHCAHRCIAANHRGLIISSPAPSATARRLSVLRDLWPFLRPYRKQLAAALLLLSLGSATILLVPLAFRDLIDVGFGQGAKGGGFLGALDLNAHFLVLFGLAAFWALAVAARYYIVTWVGERVTTDLRSAVYARALKQSPQFFETLQTGEVLSRLTGDTTLIQTVVGSSVSMGLRSLFQFTGGMVMLAVTSFYLFSLNLGLMALLALPIFAIGRARNKLSRAAQDKIADASALAGEILNAMPTVQSYTQEQRETRRISERAEASFASAVRRTRVRALLTGLIIAAVSGTIIFVQRIGARTRV